MMGVAAIDGPFLVTVRVMAEGLYRGSVMCQSCRHMHAIQVREGEAAHGLACPKCGAAGMVRFS